VYVNVSEMFIYQMFIRSSNVFSFKADAYDFKHDVTIQSSTVNKPQ